VSCVPDFVSFSGLSIVDFYFGFLKRLFYNVLTYRTILRVQIYQIQTTVY
jgi:hypothetical protein